MFVADKLKFDDFSELKKDYQRASGTLRTELNTVMVKLNHIAKQFKQTDRSNSDIFHNFQDWNVADKKQIINLIPPDSIDIKTGEMSLRLDNALSKILLLKLRPGTRLFKTLPVKNLIGTPTILPTKRYLLNELPLY